jgi:triacylglycerol lipase
MKNNLWLVPGMFLAAAFLATGTAQSQVPPDIEAQLIKIGHIVDPVCTAKLYRPLMPKNDIMSDVTPLYSGVTIARDLSFGPNPKDVVDIFTADQGPASRPVLIYVPGGAGNKIEMGDKEANAFFDNIVRWATENGMVGVMMQRHGLAPGSPPDFYAGAKDVSAMLQWVEGNISKYHGNPDRMFIWAHSAGNGPLGIYLGHPELYGPKGVGVQRIIFMSGQFGILREDGTNPVPQPAGGPGGGANPLAGAGQACGAGGAAAGGPGGPGGGAGGGGRGAAPPVPVDELIKRSSLPVIEKINVKLFLASAELDPGVDGKMSPFNQALHDELCKLDGPKAVDGKGHCPMMLFETGESHMSEVFSIDTPDKTVSGPILKWIQSSE